MVGGSLRPPGGYGATVDLSLPGEDDPRRAAVRAWLQEHPRPSGRQLAEAGYVAPHWPEPWGLGADAIGQLLVDEELRRAGVRRPENPIGIGWAGPTILQAGTTAQRGRYLPPMLAGEEIWCQLFSEPDAGSDLAGLRTKAVRDGNDYVVSGQKIWTSYAHQAALGILLCRTGPEAPKRAGITYLICDMHAPGVTIRPIVEMTGAHNFNEVFLDEVRIPSPTVWATRTPAGPSPRSRSATSGSPSPQKAPSGAVALRPVTSSISSARPAAARTPCCASGWHGSTRSVRILRMFRLRTVADAVAGRAAGPEASLRKALSDAHGQAVMALAKDLCGTAGLLQSAAPGGEPDPVWAFGFLFAPALTIGGGTAEVQRNIIAERVLGLPHDPEADTYPSEPARLP